MSLLFAFLRHEWRTSLRSLRFRVLAVAFVGVSTLPALAYFLTRTGSTVSRSTITGPGTCADAAFAVSPLLAALFAAFVAADGITREHDEGSLVAVSLAPISNAGYVLRRWIAVSVCVVPWTFVPPMLAAALSALAGNPPDPLRFVWPWLVHLLPLTLVATALGMGLGTIAGGTMLATILGSGLVAVVFGLGNDVLARFGRTVEFPSEWFGIDRIQIAIWKFQDYEPYLPSDAPYDPAAAFAAFAPSGALLAGAGALALALSTAFLRRTRPNHRPWPSLRFAPTAVRELNRFRSRYAPDPGLGMRDRVVIGAGVVLFLAAIGYVDRRDRHYRAIAAARYGAEISGGPPPSPRGLVPGRWVVGGEISNSGALSVEVAGVLRNIGATPEARLALSLNPALNLREARADLGEVRTSVTWDRVVLDLSPPIAPGQERELHFRLDGAPGEDDIHLPSSRSSVGSYEALVQARHANQLTDLSRSTTTLAISGRRVALTASDLMPVPRYVPWTLTGKDREVPPEAFFPTAELELDLAVPPGLLLADSCGNVVTNHGGHGRLQASCRIPLQDYTIRGGNHVLLAAELGLGAVAVLPAHASLIARVQSGTLATAAELAPRVWPKLDPLRSSVIMEWPPAFNALNGSSRGGGPPSPIDANSRGRLLLLTESYLAHREPIDPSVIAAEAVATELGHRRLLVKMVHNGIEYGLMAAYAEGLSVLRDANIGKQSQDPDAETTPLRDPEHYQYDLKLGDIAEVWRRGSVIASWLLDLTADALARDVKLSDFEGRVSDSGEGRWTIKAAIDEGVPVPVLTTALYARFASRGAADFQGKVLSAMRYGFGGHLEKPGK